MSEEQKRYQRLIDYSLFSKERWNEDQIKYREGLRDLIAPKEIQP